MSMSSKQRLPSTANSAIASSSYMPSAVTWRRRRSASRRLRIRMWSPGIASSMSMSVGARGVKPLASYLPDSSHGLEAHAVAVKIMGCEDVIVGSSLLNMYCKLGLLSYAHKVYDMMPSRNFVSWAVILLRYAFQKVGDEAFVLFRLLLEEGEYSVNEFALTSALYDVAHQDFSGKGWQIHCLAVKNGNIFLNEDHDYCGGRFLPPKPTPSRPINAFSTMRPSCKVSRSPRRSDGEGAHAPAVPSEALPSSLAGAFRTRAVALLRGTTPDITEQHVWPLRGSPARKVCPKGTEQVLWLTARS
ncbi:hypothetical protein Taro_022982 [Colocasia esculenta]|uniref:Pentatricopeptide repeat-containing protein n=1 Tax=Colocasia esculenta TaxID=4460 RepID=A0A843V573_COLES|nr:hypothetical protein [Colocasia esculenta]